MSNLYFYNYNTYFNRIVKKETSLANYGTPTHTILNANFYEADGVETTHTVNIPNANEDKLQANYLVVTDNSNNIKSRWFVHDTVHNRNRQYICPLRRDLMVDYYDCIINSPCLIEKALVDKNNPLIFNNEGFSFNQIKKNERLLSDDLFREWLIIYTAKNLSTTSVTVKTDNNQIADVVLGTTINSSIFGSEQRGRPENEVFEVWTRNYWKDTTVPGHTINNYYIYLIYSDRVKERDTDSRPNSSLVIGTANSSPKSIIQNRVNYSDVVDDFEIDYNNAYPTALSSINETLMRNAISNSLVVEDSNGDYYRVKVSAKKHSSSLGGDKDYYFAQSINTDLGDSITTAANDSTYEANYDYYTYTTEIIKLDNLSFTFTLDPATKSITNAEYNVIALPLGEIIAKEGDVDEQGYYPSRRVNTSYDNVIAIGRAIAQALTSDAVYDMQILPYCPIQNFIYDREAIDIYNMDSKQYQRITYNTDDYYLFFIEGVNQTFDIGLRIDIESYTGDDDIDTKISNECDIYRLVSPNYNSLFEFSVAKNDGVTKFNVDMTLRPYQPYIHINPDFKNLYGDDYNDSRGLILSGDFSLPIINDAFKQYELQNKNYQLIFDRNIKHMDIEHKLSRYEAGFGAITGTIQGGTAGALLTGGPGGAIAGGVASGIGGVLDYTFLKKRQSENKDLAIDMFNYNLGNIKALPYSISKVNPFSYNYKKFPFLEYFSCTDEEKDILVEKIKYNSMTIMSIGNIIDYIRDDLSFIKGTLIRFFNVDGCEINDHEINEIYNELQKGVYI